MEDHASQFRRHAHESRELAKNTADERQRDLLHEIAGHWEALAELWGRMRRSSPDRG